MCFIGNPLSFPPNKAPPWPWAFFAGDWGLDLLNLCMLLKGKDTFLAALDFDMAFRRQNFLPDAVPGGGLGLETFDGILAFEASMGLKTALRTQGANAAIL